MVKGSVCIGVYSLLVCMVFSIGCEVTDVPEGMSAAVSFEAKTGSYVIGDTVKAVLKNGSEHPVGYSLCDVKLEYKKAGKWIPEDLSVVCQYKLQTLAPGGEETYRLALDDSLELSKGTYRLKTSIEIEERQTLATQPFEVRDTTQE